MSTRQESWLIVGGEVDARLASELTSQVEQWHQTKEMPRNEVSRVGDLSTMIARGGLVLSPHRMELLRELCHLYSAEIRAEKITSHRPCVGPLIVGVKRVLFRVIATLLGPTFQRQRQFNATVIRLLGDLANSSDRSVGAKEPPAE